MTTFSDYARAEWGERWQIGARRWGEPLIDDDGLRRVLPSEYGALVERWRTETGYAPPVSGYVADWERLGPQLVKALADFVDSVTPNDGTHVRIKAPGVFFAIEAADRLLSLEAIRAITAPPTADPPAGLSDTGDGENAASGAAASVAEHPE